MLSILAGCRFRWQVRLDGGRKGSVRQSAGRGERSVWEKAGPERGRECMSGHGTGALVSPTPSVRTRRRRNRALRERLAETKGRVGTHAPGNWGGCPAQVGGILRACPRAPKRRNTRLVCRTRDRQCPAVAAGAAPLAHLPLPAYSEALPPATCPRARHWQPPVGAPGGDPGGAARASEESRRRTPQQLAFCAKARATPQRRPPDAAPVARRGRAPQSARGSTALAAAPRSVVPPQEQVPRASLSRATLRIPSPCVRPAALPAHAAWGPHTRARRGATRQQQHTCDLPTRPPQPPHTATRRDAWHPRFG